MSTVITLPGENLIARCQAEGRVLTIDKMVVGNVPGTDPLAEIDRNTQLPEAEQIVDELVIPDEYKAYVNPNQVVYSIVMDANRGNYDFNWIGLYSSEDDTVVAIATLPTISKYKTDGAIQGNHLTRNIVLEFFGAKESTGMSVEAATWQLDFSARLRGIDEHVRSVGRDMYGPSIFWKEGWKLEKEGDVYHLLPGVGYVEGIRVELTAPLPISGEYAPKYVWLDVSMQPVGSEVVATAVPVYGMDFSNRVVDGIAHYFVKIAKIDVDGSCIDYRNVENIDFSFFSYFKATQEEMLNRLDVTRVEKPRNGTPAEGAVNVNDPVTFTGSAPRSLYGVAIVAAEIRIATDKDMNNVIYTGTETNPSGELAHTATDGTLQVLQPYWWDFAYEDEDGNKSPYSDPTGFTTAELFEYPIPPEVLSPAANSEDVMAPLTVTLSDFAAFGAEDTLAGSRIEASYDNFETVFFDSGEVAPGTDIVITEADGLVVSSDLYLRPYHKGTNLGWSAAGPICQVRMADAFNSWLEYTGVFNGPKRLVGTRNGPIETVVPIDETSAMLFAWNGAPHAAELKRTEDANYWTENNIGPAPEGVDSDYAADKLDNEHMLAFVRGNSNQGRLVALDYSGGAWSWRSNPVASASTVANLDMVALSPTTVICLYGAFGYWTVLAATCSSPLTGDWSFGVEEKIDSLPSSQFQSSTRFVRISDTEAILLEYNGSSWRLFQLTVSGTVISTTYIGDTGITSSYPDFALGRITESLVCLVWNTGGANYRMLTKSNGTWALGSAKFLASGDWEEVEVVPVSDVAFMVIGRWSSTSWGSVSMTRSSTSTSTWNPSAIYTVGSESSYWSLRGVRAARINNNHVLAVYHEGDSYTQKMWAQAIIGN